MAARKLGRVVHVDRDARRGQLKIISETNHPGRGRSRLDRIELLRQDLVQHRAEGIGTRQVVEGRRERRKPEVHVRHRQPVRVVRVDAPVRVELTPVPHERIHAVETDLQRRDLDVLEVAQVARHHQVRRLVRKRINRGRHQRAQEVRQIRRNTRRNVHPVGRTLLEFRGTAHQHERPDRQAQVLHRGPNPLITVERQVHRDRIPVRVDRARLHPEHAVTQALFRLETLRKVDDRRAVTPRKLGRVVHVDRDARRGEFHIIPEPDHAGQRRGRLGRIQCLWQDIV